MRITLFAIFILVTALSVSANGSGAQSASRLPKHAVTLSVGTTNGSGGDFVDRSALAAALSLERALVTRGRVDVVGDINGLLVHRFGSDLSCGIREDGSCAPVEPDVVAVGSTIGARYEAAHVQFKARVGPEFYAAQRSVPHGAGVGVLWGFDAALMVTQHIGLKFSQDTHHVKFYGERIRVTARLLGARIAW